MADSQLRRGIYDNDYFSGAQVGLYIGDVWVDEVTSLAFQVQQSRTPIYGYASPLFDDVSKGQVIVQGQFSINFKEAGYLWLVLNRYKQMQGKGSKLNPINANSAIMAKEWMNTYNIEQITSDHRPTLQGTQQEKLKTLAEWYSLGQQASLAGFSSIARATGQVDANGNLVGAESIFEAFENMLWNGKTDQTLGGLPIKADTRRADDPDLNPFDIYITYGDYTGDDRVHHTMQCLREVYILGNSKQVVIDGQPVQEVYQFIAKDLI